jgi:hypothetical protein
MWCVRALLACGAFETVEFPLSMSASRKQRYLCLFALTFLLLEPSLEKRAWARALEEKSAGSALVVRPCAARKESSKSARKDKTKGKGTAGSEEAAIACLEAKDSALNIQEFFQSYLRAQAWRFGEERIVADGWIFARYLDKDELLQFAKEGPFAGNVTWTEGKAIVLLVTRKLDDGFTHVEISARMQGFGQNVDRFAPPRDSWNLDSSGVLEKNLIAALEDHCKSLHSSPPP